MNANHPNVAKHNSWNLYIKFFPAEFAQRQVDAGMPLLQNRLEYMSEIEKDKEFNEVFFGIVGENPSPEPNIDAEWEALTDEEIKIRDVRRKETQKKQIAMTKAQNQLLNEAAYEIYVDGYFMAQKKKRAQDMEFVKMQLDEGGINGIQDVVKFSNAIDKILFNCDRNVLKLSVVKLVSWLQWFKASFYPDDDNQLLDANALIFYSSIGATGKSILQHAFKKACDKLKVNAKFMGTTEIAGRFMNNDIKKINVAIIEDFQIYGQVGTDVNPEKLNHLIDRAPVAFERKNKDIETIETNISILAGTNYKMSNRRFSVIPMNEEEVEGKNEYTPTPAELVEAWYDAILLCPSHKIHFEDIKRANARQISTLTENVLKLWDYVQAQEMPMVSISVRSVIKLILGKDREIKRKTHAIITDLKTLAEKGILEKESPRSNSGWQVAKVKIDFNKFEEYIDKFETENAKEEFPSVEAIIWEVYISQMKNMPLDKKLTQLKNELKTAEDKIELIEAQPAHVQEQYKAELAEYKHQRETLPYQIIMEEAYIQRLTNLLASFEPNPPPDST